MPLEPYRYQSYCRIVWWHGLGMLRYALEPLALPPMPRGGSPVEIDNALDQGSIGRQLGGSFATFARVKPYSLRICAFFRLRPRPSRCASKSLQYDHLRRWTALTRSRGVGISSRALHRECQSASPNIWLPLPSTQYASQAGPAPTGIPRQPQPGPSQV